MPLLAIKATRIMRQSAPVKTGAAQSDASARRPSSRACSWPPPPSRIGLDHLLQPGQRIVRDAGAPLIWMKWCDPVVTAKARQS